MIFVMYACTYDLFVYGIFITRSFIGYTARPVNPAKNYDVVSFGRAMNDDFGQRVKKLFDPEREAALHAQQTGVFKFIISHLEVKGIILSF